MKIMKRKILGSKPAVFVSGKKEDKRWILVSERVLWKSPKKVSEMYGISLPMIYEFIKTEPDFPYRNIGRKKFLIDIIALDEWFTDRTLREKRRHMWITKTSNVVRECK